MTASQKAILGCLTLTLIFVCLAGAGLWFLPRLPSVNQQVPLNSDTILVTLATPLNGSHFPENGFVPVQAIIHSQNPIVLMELWADGGLIEAKTPAPGSSLTDLSARWNFSMGGPGDRTLIVRAKDANGQIGASNGVRIGASAAVGGRSAYSAKPGDTLEKIAASADIPKQKIYDANPSLTPTTPITPGQYVFIPIAPHAPYPPPKLITPVPPSGNAQSASEASFIEISLLGQGLFGKPALPQPPSLAASIDQCNVNLLITDQTTNEDGFFVYRLDANHTFQRIATLAANNGALPLYYTDFKLSGKTQYYIAAFNAAGEAKSNLIGVEINAPTCGSTPPSGLEFENGILTLSQFVDKAYVYGAINQGAFLRIPTDPQKFLTPVQGKINLAQYINDLVKAANVTPHEIDLEAWGWKGNVLYHLGALHTTLDQTSLTICKLGVGCTGDMGRPQRDVKDAIPANQPKQVREFYWNTSTPGATHIVWQISTLPFTPAFEAKPAGWVASDNLPVSASDSGASGAFQVDFAKFTQANNAATPKPTPQATPASGNPWLFQVLNPGYATVTKLVYPINFYARIVPMQGNQPAGPLSNPVVITYGSTDPQPSIDLSSSFAPNIYDVQVVGFTGVQPPTLPWGCVIIKGLDPQWLDEDDRKLFQKLLTTGEPYCPEPWKGVGEKPWYEQMFDFVSGAVSWVAETFDDLKNLAVQFAAALIPGCNQICRDALKAGLEIGLTALGVPPELPNLDQLVDEGLGYLVEAAVQELPGGEMCGDLCKDKLKDGIKELAKSAAQRSVDNTQNAEIAHAHGVEPLRLPNMVAATPAPGSTYQPASVQIKITRKPLPPNASSADPKRYRLVIRTAGENESLKGKTVSWPTSVSCNDNGCWFTDAVSVPILNTPKGWLFEPVSAPVPDLLVGSSMTVRFSLTPTKYWLPEHGYPSKYPSESYYYNDWQHLYNDGKINVRASIECPGTWGACGGSHDVTIPFPYTYSGK